MTIQANDYHGIVLRHRPDIFRCPVNAKRSAARRTKPHRVILGEVGDHLIVCNADAQRLVRAGYCLAGR